MIKNKLDNSPIAYYISRKNHREWILFIHAAFVNHNMFKSQYEYFKDKYNILSVDLIGHGNSTETHKGDGIDKMSDWINRILEDESIDKVHIIGVSLGSVIAQDFANKYPSNVRSLACFGGYDINNFDEALQKDNNSHQSKMMLKALLSVKWFAKDNKKISAYTPKAQDEFYEMNIKFPKRSFMYLATMGSMINKHKTEKRNYPLLIGCGEYDVPMEKEAIIAWKKSEPKAQVVIFENAGHCVNMDVPLEFNEVMENLWTELKQ